MKKNTYFAFWSKNVAVAGMLMICSMHAKAAWVDSPTPGLVTSVRTYQINLMTGLRVQLNVAGFVNTCGNADSSVYFDSDKISLDSVKAAMALATSALSMGKNVLITYDCTLGGGGGAWGTAIQVLN